MAIKIKYDDHRIMNVSLRKRDWSLNEPGRSPKNLSITENFKMPCNLSNRSILF